MIKVIKDLNGYSHKIDIQKKALWVWPYLLKARQLGIPIWRIKKIKTYYVPHNQEEQQRAQIVRHSGEKKFVITFLYKYQILKHLGAGVYEFDRYENALDGYWFEETLHSLAHELAHITHWDHDADRFIQEARLHLGFARLSKKLGYKGYDVEDSYHHDQEDVE